MEVGISGSYRKSYIDTQSYDESEAWTGSLDYYFAPSSAIELSYTDGLSIQNLHSDSGIPDQTTSIYYEMAGVDLVLTLLKPGDVIRPYIKGGGAYILKKDLAYATGGQVVVIGGQWGTDLGFVSNAGAGIKIAITRDFAIKAGAEGWASSPSNSSEWDIMGHLGVDWML